MMRVVVLIATALLGVGVSAEMRAEDFRIRDPFVLPDAKTKTYYLYGVEHYLGEECDETGVWVRKSADLKTWSEPRRVMSAPKGIQCVWAPEVHQYKGAYYMFATLKEYPDPNKPLVMMGPTPDWSSNLTGVLASWHAVWIYRAESPEGPFLPVSGKPITPPGWIALDGTLANEDGRPYLVFTHDWAQVADGTIEMAPLTDDLSALAAPPKTLFKASAIAPGTLRGVTDGPFVYRSPKSGKLFITWSTHNPAKLRVNQGGYCVVSSESASGRLAGPWVNHHIIFDANGGHGMTFRALDGSQKFILHNPELWGSERLAIYDFTDNGEKIGIVETRETKAFQRAIDKASAEGGGRVTVPAGEHLVGALHLRSNVELHFEDGATLVFSDDKDDYLPAVRTSWEGTDCLNYSPLVYAYGCTNVAITGRGTLAPKLKRWVPWRTPPGAAVARRKLSVWSAAGVPVEARDMTKFSDSGMRPHLLQFLSCKDVRLDGFAIRGAPFWTIHLCRSSDIAVKGLDVSAWGEADIAMNNTDGIDIDMSRNVTVEDCTFRQNDDAIVIKAGRDVDGRKNGVPSENILIRNCTVREGHVLLGLGSEVSAGIRNVRMENCRVEGETSRLVFIKTNPRRGGFVENVTVDGVTATRVSGDIVCIETRYFYGQPGQEVMGPNPVLTRIEGLTVRNVRCDWAKRAVTLLGDADYPVRNVTLENIVADVVFERFARIENVDGIKMDVTARKVYPDAQW